MQAFVVEMKSICGHRSDGANTVCAVWRLKAMGTYWSSGGRLETEVFDFWVSGSDEVDAAVLLSLSRDDWTAATAGRRPGPKRYLILAL